MMTIIAILIKLKARNITNKSLPFFAKIQKKQNNSLRFNKKNTINYKRALFMRQHYRIQQIHLQKKNAEHYNLAFRIYF